jgi:recombination protein RecR
VSGFSSKLLEEAVNELARLPGIGKKTALRLALHLLKESEIEVVNLSNALIRMRTDLQYCESCHNISDDRLCALCSDPKRESRTVCVVQDIRDVIAIENTHQYRGLYHILGGVISPMEGISPDDLNIHSLVTKIEQGHVTEIIMALPATMEGDTTNFYIYKKVKEFNIVISTIARGVSIGDELEYADEVTLGRSILNRMPYQGGLTY